MPLFQILFGIYFAFLGAYLSVVMTRLLRQNGKGLQEMGEKISQNIKKTSEKLGELIKVESQATRELIESESQATRELIVAIKEQK